ncbi:unnamed protein product [Phyllotreta striolata]|uniref:aralkylamine N-acetyltransferase n=1 Tax=Phyllotreta striolata TaxID=444603 RepID=A0A9N9THZ8_PHYSR|nr:unnamed protein product [Phyllotreta striolata]
MSTTSEITIRTAGESDKEPIRQFFRTFFFKDEPLNDFLQLITDESPVNEDLERFVLQSFGKGLDLVAEYQGRLVGVCLNNLFQRDEPVEPFRCSPGNKFQNIVDLLEHVEATVDYFGKYPIERLVSIGIISVDASVRGKGIAKKLVARTKEISREHKAELLVVECTSFYSAAAAKSLGFDEIFSLDFADYKKNGTPVFNPPAPHKAVTAYVTKL